MTNSIAVTLNITDASGAPLQDGMAYIFPTAVLTDSSDVLLVSQRPLAVDFNPTTSTQFGPAGFPVVNLPLYTDQAGVQPSGWAWQIVFKGDSMPPSQTFSLLTANGAAQNFSALATVQNATTYQAYMPLPTGTPSSGQVPIATGIQEGSAWSPLPAATTSIPGIVQLDGTASDIQPTGTAAVAGAKGQAADAFHVHKQNWGGLFGDASDGSVTMDGVATFPNFASLGGSTYTLTRDVFATNFTVNSGITLITANFRIFCQGTFTNNGTLRSTVPNNAAGATAGAIVAAGSLQGGQPGGTGGTGVGPAGTATNGSIGTGSGGSGGSSGASGGNNAGGATVGPKTGTGPLHLPGSAISGVMWGKSNSLTSVLAGAPGGSAGGGDGVNSGGGGGSGANTVVVYAWAFINGPTGSITAIGGNGGTPPSGNCGGGGGGGGGLILIYTLVAWTNNGSTTVTGGSPGGGIGSGAAGSSGTSGNVLNVLVS